MRLINSLSEIGLKSDDFPIFFWDQWLAFEKSSKCQTFLFVDETIKAVVPFKVHKLKFLKKGEYIYKPLNFSGNELSIEDEKEFIECFHDFLAKKGFCDVIFPPQHVVNFKCIPEKTQYFSIGIIILDIPKTGEEVLSKMKANYRNEIRKARKMNIQVHFGRKWVNEFYEVYRQTHQLQGMEYEDIEHFNRLIHFMPENAQVGISKLDANLECGFFNIFDYKTAYYSYAGIGEKTIVPGSNKLLLYEAIRFYQAQGFKKFIFGGCRPHISAEDKKNEIQNFKIRFGAEIEQGYHFIKIVSPFRYWLFEFALKMKSFLIKRELSFFNKSGLDIKWSD